MSARAHIYLSSVFAAIIFALGWLLLKEENALRTESSSISIPARTKADTAIATRATRFKMEPIASYSPIEKRPLFTASRRPSKAPQKPVSRKQIRPLNLILSGVIITNNQKTALVRLDGSPKILSIPEGNKVDGWQLKKILRDRVLFNVGDNTAEFTIWKEADSARPDIPARGARAGR